MGEKHNGTDVAVVGGGVIGCALAHALARRGAEVTVLEGDRAGRGATWAAAGMLTPQGEGRVHGPYLSLCMDSLALYPALAATLLEETGLDVAFRRVGTVVAATDESEADRLRAEGERYRSDGTNVRWLDRSDLLAAEPALGPATLGGLSFPDEAQVDNRLLGRALWQAARRAGARVLEGRPVRTVDSGGGRVTGVTLSDGSRLSARRVVLAAGAWSGLVGGLPRTVPVRPVRGQMLSLETAPPPIRSQVSVAHVYLVPRASGHVLVGATLEEAGFDARTTAGGLGTLLGNALRAVPCLAGASLTSAWAGLRPGTPDERPILGADPDLEGLYYATGHFRNGILLTPVTARVMADVVSGTDPGTDLAPYSPGRFG